MNRVDGRRAAMIFAGVRWGKKSESLDYLDKRRWLYDGHIAIGYVTPIRDEWLARKRVRDQGWRDIGVCPTIEIAMQAVEKYWALDYEGGLCESS
jgi:hypothetical protein